MSTTTTTKTVAASTAAALLIAGGVALYETTNDDPSKSLLTLTGINQTEQTSNSAATIDWSLYDLNIPTVDIPTLDVPTIPTVVVALDAPIVKVDGVDIPNVNGETTVKVETVSMPVIDTKTGVDIAMEQSSNAIVDATTLKDLNSSLKDFNTTIVNATPDDPSKDIPEWIAFIEETNKIFADKRSIQHDKSFVKSNPIITDWLKIYKEYENAPDVSYVAIKKPFKMITEARIPSDSTQLDILTKNLAYYKSEGYDSVLVAFDKNDIALNVLNTIRYIRKYCNMNVWLTYTGKESLYETVFMDVNKYKEILTVCAPYIDGYVNSWRKTSAHLLEQDKQFMSFTNLTLRKANPNLPIIGELYYGNTHKYDTVGNIGFGLNNFKNSSGIMIVNFGFKRIDVNYLVDHVLKPYVGTTPLIACVVGHKPYYMTTYNNGLDYKANMKIKHEVEQKFLDKGFIGVVTLSNDGREMETNNLSTTLYNTLQGVVK